MAAIRAAMAGESKINPPESENAEVPAPQTDPTPTPEQPEGDTNDTGAAEQPETTQPPAEPAEAPTKPKRKRRTKAEKEAARKAEAEAILAINAELNKGVEAGSGDPVTSSGRSGDVAPPSDGGPAAPNPSNVRLQLPGAGGKPINVTISITIDQVTE